MKAGNQMSLPFGFGEGWVGEHFRRAVPKPVSVTVTENTSSVFSFTEKGGAVSIRISRHLLGAGQEVLDELAGFVRKGRGATPLLGRFLKENRNLIRGVPRRRPRPRIAGRVRDLGPVFERLNREYFGGRIRSTITWGANSNSRRRVRNRTLGSYCFETDTIRISPTLDTRSVPLYYLKYVLYHEMLHADMSEETGKPGEGRRVFHTREFRRRERLFDEYARAMSWERGDRYLGRMK